MTTGAEQLTPGQMWVAVRASWRDEVTVGPCYVMVYDEVDGDGDLTARTMFAVVVDVSLPGRESVGQSLCSTNARSIADFVAAACNAARGIAPTPTDRERDRLAARVAELEAGLRPFAAILQPHHADGKDGYPFYRVNAATITFGDLRRAAALLGEGGGG